MSTPATLAERLGYSRDARLLIVNCGDLGVIRGVNDAIFDALRSGRATSTSLMAPCPWAEHAARSARPDDDIGVHLTLTSEWQGYGWGPLRDGVPRAFDGRLPSDIAPVIAEVRAGGHRAARDLYTECAKQIDTATAWGVDVSHLDSHMGVLQTDQVMVDLYLDLAAEYRLPVRMLPASTEASLGLTGRQWAADRGVLHPDQMLFTYLDARPIIERSLASMRPGVTEVLLHPSLDTDELRLVFRDADERVANREFLVGERSLAEQAAEHGIELIGYRALRDLQREEARDRERSVGRFSFPQRHVIQPDVPRAVDDVVRRRRTSLLVHTDRPVPDDVVDELCRLLTWAPNHKRTWPWQMAWLTGDARRRLGDVAADAMAARGDDDAKVTKTRTKYLRSPGVLVVGSDLGDSPLRAVENRDAVAAGIQNLLLGATARGLASFWASCPKGAGDAVAELCEFPTGTQIVAIVYLGWPTGTVEAPERPEPPLRRLTT